VQAHPCRKERVKDGAPVLGPSRPSDEAFCGGLNAKAEALAYLLPACGVNKDL